MDLSNKLKLIKSLIKEESYQSGFNKIQGGDMFVIVTDKHIYNAKVVDKTSNQIATQIDGKNYIFTNNSLEGDKVEGVEVINGVRKNRNVKGVKHIIIRRNGNTVTTLTSDGKDEEDFDDFDDDEVKKEDPKVDEIYKNCLKTLKLVEKDNKIIINIGKMDDNLKMTDEIIGRIEIHAREITEKEVIVGAVTKFDGEIDNKINPIKEDFIAISKNKSLEINENGVVMRVRTRDKSDYFIETIANIEIGDFFNIHEPTFDELMNGDKGFRNLMLKEPSLMGKISGELAKGVIPATKILKDLGLTHSYFTQGKKVRFIYTGESIIPKKKGKLRLDSGKEYVGIFSTSRSIKLTGSNRGESLIVKLKRKTHEQVYEVEVEFHKIVDGEEIAKSIGRGIIQIKDINFR